MTGVTPDGSRPPEDLQLHTVGVRRVVVEVELDLVVGIVGPQPLGGRGFPGRTAGHESPHGKTHDGTTATEGPR